MQVHWVEANREKARFTNSFYVHGPFMLIHLCFEMALELPTCSWSPKKKILNLYFERIYKCQLVCTYFLSNVIHVMFLYVCFFIFHIVEAGYCMICAFDLAS